MAKKGKAKAKDIERFKAERLEGNEAVMRHANLPIKRYYSLDSQAYRKGALPAKTKELMGLVASMVLRCNDCIFYHLDRGIAEGATREELHEAMNIALIVGGSIVIPHLRFAFESIEELTDS